jgi:hypothetical protein
MVGSDLVTISKDVFLSSPGTDMSANDLGSKIHIIIQKIKLLIYSILI